MKRFRVICLDVWWTQILLHGTFLLVGWGTIRVHLLSLSSSMMQTNQSNLVLLLVVDIWQWTIFDYWFVLSFLWCWVVTILFVLFTLYIVTKLFQSQLLLLHELLVVTLKFVLWHNTCFDQVLLDHILGHVIAQILIFEVWIVADRVSIHEMKWELTIC